MIAAMSILAISAVLMAGILFKQQRALTLLACAGSWWQAQWLILVLIKRTVGQETNPEMFFLVLSIVWIDLWEV